MPLRACLTCYWNCWKRTTPNKFLDSPPTRFYYVNKYSHQAMGTEKVQTQIRRDQIAQAVLRLISRHGLKGLNMARVAAEIGLVPSALYRHFRGKEEMVDAALDVIRLRLLGNVDAVCQETENALERLRLLLGRHLEMIRDNQAIPRIIFSEEVYAGHSDRKIKVYHLVKTFLSQVEAIVRMGQKTGQIRKNFEPKMVSVLFLGLFQPAAVLWYLSDGRYDVSRHIHRAWPIFKEAIKGEQPLPTQKNIVVKKPQGICRGPWT
jgi:AcrR family transcriptional regulator